MNNEKILLIFCLVAGYAHGNFVAVEDSASSLIEIKNEKIKNRAKGLKGSERKEFMENCLK